MGSLFYTVVTSVAAICGIVYLYLYLRDRKPRPATDELYQVVPLDELWQRLPRPGSVEPHHVDRAAAAGLDPARHRCLLITGPPETGKTFEALHSIRRFRQELKLPELRVVLPKATPAVPETLPPDCRRDLVLLLDDLHQFADDAHLGQSLRAVVAFFREHVRDRQFFVVATARAEHLPALRTALGETIFAEMTGQSHGCHVRLDRLAGGEEKDCLRAIGEAFGFTVGESLAAQLAEANDGTLVAVYDFLQGRAEHSHVLGQADIRALEQQVRNHWRGTILPNLPSAQQRIVACLSILRSCRVPMHEWIVHEMIRREDDTTNRLRALLWPFKAARLRRAANRLRHAVPLGVDRLFTPHDARLDLDGDAVADAVAVAAALVPLCDRRPVRDGLREAYASVAATLQAREEFAKLVPVLTAWCRTSTGHLKNDPPVARLAEQVRATAASAAQTGTEAWAGNASRTGNIWWKLPTGDRADNLRRAIACYEAALRVRTEQDFPQDWAGIQNNLGIAYRNLPSGDRADNLRQAIACYEAALRVYTEQDFPQDWAGIQNNLGIAYRNLPSGDRAANLRRAIACYEAALRVYTEQDFPQDWAMTQNNLGVACQWLPSGDRADNLRRAIASFEAALRVYTKQDFPQQWATTQNNLGNAYWGLPSGDRADNLRRAIACYEAALRVYTEQDFPQDWAMTQNNLGIAYRNLPSGDRADSLHRAITCYGAALRVRTEQDFPQNWALTTENVAYAYLDEDMPGDRCANLTTAHRLLTDCLRVLTEETFPHNHAKVQGALEDVAAARREAGCPD